MGLLTFTWLPLTFALVRCRPLPLWEVVLSPVLAPKPLAGFPRVVGFLGVVGVHGHRFCVAIDLRKPLVRFQNLGRYKYRCPRYGGGASMNNHDYKALLISIISGIVAGIAVNVIWAISTAPGHPLIDHRPTTQWVLQVPVRPPAVAPV